MEHCRFLFIPGPHDVGGFIRSFFILIFLSYFLLDEKIYLVSAGPSTVLPRCPLPKYITEELQKYIPLAIFSSNPCR